MTQCARFKSALTKLAGCLRSVLSTSPLRLEARRYPGPAQGSHIGVRKGPMPMFSGRTGDSRPATAHRLNPLRPQARHSMHVAAFHPLAALRALILPLTKTSATELAEGSSNACGRSVGRSRAGTKIVRLDQAQNFSINVTRLFCIPSRIADSGRASKVCSHSGSSFTAT
jgi:hypothetical protein